MHKWQKELWAAISGSGVKASEMKIIMNGRQIGKSTMAQMWNQVKPDEEEITKCEIIAKAKVDNKQWYTVKCSRDVAKWVRQQPDEHIQWYQHIDQKWMIDHTMFDIDEDLYLMLRLKWGC